MSKYAPLGDYLRKQRTERVPMTFSEIEHVVRTRLPQSQRYPAWWSNNPWNNVMTQVWLDAGFKTEDVDVEARRLVFRRVKEFSPTPKNGTSPSDNTKGAKIHPLIGALKGTVWIAPGTDLTQPADSEWGDVAYGDRTWDDNK
jgi:hypothetical protein